MFQLCAILHVADYKLASTTVRCKPRTKRKDSSPAIGSATSQKRKGTRSVQPHQSGKGAPGHLLPGEAETQASEEWLPLEPWLLQIQASLIVESIVIRSTSTGKGLKLGRWTSCWRPELGHTALMGTDPHNIPCDFSCSDGFGTPSCAAESPQSPLFLWLRLRVLP